VANPDGLIDSTLAYYDGVDPDDGDNAARRAQLLQFLQHVYEYVRNYREWQFTYKTGTITILAGTTSIAVPTDFMEFGGNGHLYDPSRRLRMIEATIHDFERLRQELTASPDYYFAVIDDKIHVTVAPAANRALTIIYRTKPETLADGTTTILMPDRYANLTLLPALIYRAQQSKNDARDTWGSQFRDGLSMMCALENPVQTGVRVMPRAIRGGW
jgi:hypothetical protein